MSREDIIVASQEQIEVYSGDTGYIIVKQSGGMEPDAVIHIAPEHARKVAEAILDEQHVAESIRQEWIMEGSHELT